MAWTNINKSASPTFLNILKHGKDTVLADIANFTFEDVVFDGTKLKNVTFDQLAEIVWTNVSKSSAPVFTNITRN